MANMSFYFVSALFLHCVMASLAMTAKNLTTDQSALLVFKAHITSDPHSVLAYNWSISNPVCNWVGISCGARHGRVTYLNISSMGLGGTIPPHIGNLSFLAYLDLGWSNFHGHLPNEMGQLRRLRILRLNNNNLSGGLPSWIVNLSKLRRLDLSSNNFTGPLPSNIFNSSYLKWVTIANCALSGSIPEDFFHLLPVVETVYLGGNKISGTIPKNIINCTSLRFLTLQNNLLTGEIPEEIGNLQNLEYLFLGDNSLLTGPIPPSIFNITTIRIINLNSDDLWGHLPSSFWLPNLEKFYVAENKLTGAIPNSISNSSKLTILELGSNLFSGFVPNTFGNLRLLNALNLGFNNLTTESSTAEWSFLSSLTNCRELRLLFLDHNPLYGFLPPSIGNFSQLLHIFEADHNNVRGSIPKEVGKLHGLIGLDLSYNELNGSIPTTMGGLRSLQGLFLHNNNLHGSIPNELCNLESFDGLRLSGNKLSGYIPNCLGNLISLRYLHLDSNKLTSNIPSSLWNLKYILRVNLSTNSLNGSLPLTIQNLKVLTDLDLSRNQLSGDIPFTIGDLNNLVNLSLADNKFGGPIPESFGSLISLESLDLSSNNLSGEIPKSLEALSYLKHFNVSQNKLEGKIPTKGPFKNFSAQSFMLNYALCGSSRLEIQPCRATTKRSNTVIVLVSKFVLPPIMSTILVVTAIIIFIKCRGKSENFPAREDLLPLATWRRISYLEIQRATDDFSEYNLLGVGGFGSVFKGKLLDGTNIAIKVFNLQLERAFSSFESECEVLCNIRHRNLIKILSCCCNIDFKALVLEFMPNGNLEKWLYSHNYFLDILERLNIMINVASALEYLHHGHSTPVVHCDLKPNNILLDEDMVAHVGDFGISKLLGDGDSMTHTMTLATIGYMAPEYGSLGIVSPRGDVYSFGVVLMETFTRKKPTEEIFDEGMSLKDWVKDSLPHALTQVMDANLLQEENAFIAKTNCALSILNLALDCSMDSPEQRINMKDVVARLRKIKIKFVNDSRAT